jgi:trimethylamine--corrinoid protein Co-methyltransferase
MIGWIDAFVNGIEVSDETLALDVIAQAGPEGQYLNKDHTRRHYQELWYPDLLERDDHKTWLRKGGKTLGQRATERVEEILGQHQPEPLPDDLKARVRNIVEQSQA